MDKGALIALVIGAVTLALILYLIVRRTGDVQPDPQPPGWSANTAAQRWDEKAAIAREDFGLPAIRETAKTWGASIAALLGILTTVAFVAGPTDLVKEVGGTEADVAAWLILAAAAVAAIATVLAILAEQGIPKYEDDLNGWVLRSLTQKRADKAAGQLRSSRYLVVLALLLILFATGIAWMTALTGDDAPATQKALVSAPRGLACGTLVDEGGFLALKIGDGEAQRIEGGAAITLVDSCP
jgi:hypothetical protein